MRVGFELNRRSRLHLEAREGRCFARLRCLHSRPCVPRFIQTAHVDTSPGGIIYQTQSRCLRRLQMRLPLPWLDTHRILLSKCVGINWLDPHGKDAVKRPLTEIPLARASADMNETKELERLRLTQ